MSLFDSYFTEIYGDRWPDLKAALLLPHVRAERECFNGYAKYTLDMASVEAANALRVEPGDHVLDMCAAPGGKTLVLAERLEGRGSLTANELSSARRRRLEEVINTHVPEGHRSLIRITGFDGNLFGLKKAGEYDRVLLDAPCSSERHMLEDDPEMKEWKLSRTTQLARRQYSLLCSALLSLRPGGTLVYSTCSISPAENDGVIARLLERKEGQVKVDSNTEELSSFEQTSFGFSIFPDRAKGIGPIYISRLVKL